MPKTRGKTLQLAAARLAFVGLIASAVAGGGIRVSELNESGEVKQGKTFVAHDEINAQATATGSTSSTQRYAAVCIANPLNALGDGSGTIKRLTVELGDNPAAVGGDVYLTKDCNDHTSTGHTALVDNFTTVSGSLAGSYTTGTQVWNGADFIKMTYRDDPTSSATARIRIEYEDLFGE